MHLLPVAGPRNPPLTPSARLVVLAWVEVLVALAVSLWIAGVVWTFSSPDLAALVCFDKGPDCRVDPVTAWDVVTVAAIQSIVVIGAVAAVVVTRRHRRGRATRAAAIASLAGAPALFGAAEALLWYA